MPTKNKTLELQVKSDDAELSRMGLASDVSNLFPIKLNHSKCKMHDDSHRDETKNPLHFYRLPKVLNILQISRAKFLKMVQSGQAPPPIKMSRCSLYIAEEIDKFALALVESSRLKRPFDIDVLILEITENKSGSKK